MSLQIRRGTNQERLNFTPVEGEVIYVTDSQLAVTIITDITSNVLTADDETHLAVNDPVKMISNTTNGLTEATVYYVKTVPTTQTFTLSATVGGATKVLTNGAGLTIQLAVGPKDKDGIPVGYSISPIWVGDGDYVGGLAAGAATLDELADVTIGVNGLYGINIDSNQHLQYDNGTNQWRNVNDMIIPGYVNIQSTNDATSKDTGALIVEGGVGVEKALYVGTFARIGSATDATSKDTGALVLQNGGLGVELAINSGTSITAGTNITAGGDVAVNGGDITTTASTFNIVGSATTVNIGSAGGNVIVAGDLQVTGNDIKSSTATALTLAGASVTVGGDLTVNGNVIKSSTATAVTLAGADVTVVGDLQVTGNSIKSSTGAVAIELSGNDVSMPDRLTVTNEIVLDGTQPFVSFFRETPVDGVETVRGMRGQTTIDDYWFVGGGASADDAGYLLIATSDNSATAGAGEQIIVRQYGGSGLGPANTPWNASTTVTREAKLFDENGYTVFPERLGVGTTTPTVKLDVNGSAIIRGDNLTVSGNLIVNGTTTTINSTTLTVDDKNIELGSVTTPTDTTADGGGITLRGATDKTIAWTAADAKWHISPGIVADNGQFGNIKIGVTSSNIINTVVDGLSLQSASGETRLYDNTTVNGSLTVDGAVNLAAAFPTFNSDVTGAPSENVGINVNRGTSTDVKFRWNETSDRWGSTVDGTNFIELPNQALDTTSNAVFAGATIGEISIATSTNDTTITTFNSNDLKIQSASNQIYIGAGLTGETQVKNTLYVQGDFRTDDNIFRLNYDVATGTPTSGFAGMAVRRGVVADAQWVFDETFDWWTGVTSDATPLDIYSSARVIANSDLATNGRNIIFNNDDATPTGSDNMTLLVKRGTSADVNITWDESTDRWKSTSNGSTYVNLPNQNLDTSNDVVFAAANIGNISIAASTNDNTITTSSGGLTLAGANGVITFANNAFGASLTLTGDLTVNGTTTTVNSETVLIADNIVVLNSNVTGTPTENSGIEIERGTDPNVSIQWSETGDRWRTTVDGTNYINLPDQALDVASEPSFSAVNIDAVARLNTGTLTTTTTAANQVLDSFVLASYRTVKYVIQATSTGAGCHVMECLVMHDNTTAYITTYGEMFSSASLTTIGAVVNGTNVELQVTPTNAATVYKVTKTLIAA